MAKIEKRRIEQHEKPERSNAEKGPVTEKQLDTFKSKKEREILLQTTSLIEAGKHGMEKAKDLGVSASEASSLESSLSSVEKQAGAIQKELKEKMEMAEKMLEIKRQGEEVKKMQKERSALKDRLKDSGKNSPSQKEKEEIDHALESLNKNIAQGSVDLKGELLSAIGGGSLSKEDTLTVESTARQIWDEKRVDGGKVLSVDERLSFCNPDEVRREMAESLYPKKEKPALEKFGEDESFLKNSERIKRDVDVLIASYEGISAEHKKKITENLGIYIDLISEAQKEGGLSRELKAGDAQILVVDIVEKLAYQEKETLKRALGDHGVRHIIDGNITEAMKMVEEYNKAHPDQKLSAFDKLKIMTVHYNHDMGYTASINRTGFESTAGHPSFSKKLFESDSAIYDKVFTGKDLGQMGEIIKTHDRSETDFTSPEKALESIVRLSDNLGLFQDTKLPAILYTNTENLALLQKIYIAREAGQDIGGLQKELVKSIQGQGGVDESMRTALLKAAGEINKTTPEFNLGMFAGKLEGYEMKGAQMVVKLRESDMHAQIHDLFHLENKQFVKLLDSYGIDLKKMDKKFEEEYAKDENGIRYIELPPGGGSEKSLRFEFHPPKEGGEESERDKSVRETLAKTEKEWNSISIRSEISQIITELESSQDHTEDVDKIRASVGTLLGSKKMDYGEKQKVSELFSGLNSSDDKVFQESLSGLKSFLTKREKEFLAI
ncbi:hypothetical protein HYW94_01660 [Candidatus Uhrbacteria bacterium]|nr:hypothetical protein [Candidatus Uhrbacteria bacterium]